MDISIDNALPVHKNDGSLRCLALSYTSLCHSNVTNYFRAVFNISTVKDEKTKYSALDIWRAAITRQLQEVIIGKLTAKDFLHIIETNPPQRL